MVENTLNNETVPFNTRLNIQFAHLQSDALVDAKRAIAGAMAKALGDGVTVDQSGLTVQAGKLVGRSETDVILTPVNFNGDTIGFAASTKHPEGKSIKDWDKARQWEKDQRENPDWQKVFNQLGFEYEAGPHGGELRKGNISEGKFRIESAEGPKDYNHNIKILVDRKALLDRIDLPDLNIPVLKHQLKMAAAERYGVNYHDYLQARGNDRSR